MAFWCLAIAADGKEFRFAEHALNCDAGSAHCRILLEER